MKKIIVAVCIFLSCTVTLFSQNINGRFSSSLYSYERFDTVNVSENYLRTFQILNLNINQDKFAIRTSLNYETDLSAEIEGDPRLRFYNLYLEGRDLFGFATIKFGRQPVFSNVGTGLFDGADLLLKYNRYKFQAYYGGNVPAYQKLEIAENWKDNYILGGRFTATLFDEFQVALGYVNKNYKAEDYIATRLGPDLNPIQMLVESKSNQFQFGYAQADYEMKNIFSINGKYEYDLNFEETSRIEFLGNFTQVKNLNISLYYNYHAPQIRYNSIFSVFDFGNTQEFEVGADYAFTDFFTLSGKFGFIEYKDDNSKRFSIGAISSYGTLMYRKNLGYAGEMDAVSLYTSHSFLEGFLTPLVGVSYTNYKLSKDDEVNNLTSLIAGANIRPWRTLSFDLQGQYMNNKIYQNDFRFFLKINYWFNTNLDWM